ncbi:response regulator [Microbacterium sp. 1P10UB]|uniref:response regulator n=1 Tax=unclassified Microbacterium TaxID=2609290 RepID=UPI0039A1E5A8
MISVLLVDDEPLTLELHRHYVARLDGFEVVAEATGARAAISAVLDRPPAGGIDLVLLDMNMPDGTGLDVLRHIRARGASVDVIAITSVRDADVVRQTVGLGVVHYLVKPFDFATFRERLQQYQDYRRRASDAAGDATQAEIDGMLGALRPAVAAATPKGLSADSLERVAAELRAHGPLSASEAAERLGMSRVAVRRYLEHLADVARVQRAPRYGSPGRPETEYSWRS